MKSVSGGGARAMMIEAMKTYGPIRSSGAW
jgi:spore maturation protein SpmB